jgi:cyclic pyranopterin phosphate synthase
LEGDWHVRFIEMMPLGANTTWAGDGYVSVGEVRRRIEDALGELVLAKVRVGNGPARYHRLPGAMGTIGFISPISEHFCYQCNRLRLTADGRLRPCLLSDDEIDLRTPLRRGASMTEVRELLIRSIGAKPRGHRLDESIAPRERTMSEIGG